jgi:hypothetical protein
MAEAPKDPERKGVASFKGGAEADKTSEQEQLLVTIHAPTGKIVKAEKIGKAGKPQEVTEEEWTRFVGEDEVDEIETALEEAFDAGIAAMLGEEYEDEGAYEDDDEKALRRSLIAGLLSRRHVHRRILDRVLIARVLRGHSLKAG